MIVIREPQPQETFLATEMVFDGYTNTLPGQVYNPHIPYEVDFVPSNTMTFPPVPTNLVHGKNTLNIAVMYAEGEPYVLKQLRKANDYEQFEPYENSGKMIWEASLRRDYKNNKNVTDVIFQYGQEYINTTNGVQ